MSDQPSAVSETWLEGDSARRHRRRVVEQVQVERPVEGKVRDLSEAGFCIESHKPLPVLMQGVFKLNTSRAQPEFLGQVRWCRLAKLVPTPQGDTVPVYRAGVALINE